MLYLRNKETGEIHRLDDERRSKEECNIDQIEDAEMLDEFTALREVSKDRGKVCGHCWPKENS